MTLRPPRWFPLIVAGLTLVATPAAWGKIQFDLFPGYDTSARAGTWYPVAVEVFNDGPTFDSVIELNAGQATVRIPVELPTNTRKRLVVPLFNVSRNFLSVDARLLDAGGKVREEQTGKRVNVQGWEIPLIGALPASFSGAPSLPEIQQAQPGWQPRVARLQPELFPDNPIALEGLNSLYLNTTRALELKEPQVRALLAWVHGGGQLIVAVDQPADVTSTPWLRALMPADLGALGEEPAGAVLQEWVREGIWNPEFAYKVPEPAPTGAPSRRGNRRVLEGTNPFASLGADAALNGATIPMLALRPRDGKPIVSGGTRPLTLMVEAARGRGQVVLLAFNPEREPLKSWTLRPWFFARLADIPPHLLTSGDRNLFGGRGLDGIFGAMVDTRQIRKLPVGVLLLLLVAYLVVIGPFDQWWLRRINRPMLTWITFPAYVVLFSLLIYFIGYKLRSGQTEWNEIQVVDILPQGDGTRAALRGWTFGSLYSPANETYPLSNRAEDATLRGEFRGLWGASGEPARITVTARPPGFNAEMFVPVWTSAMAVSDWEEEGSAPLEARSLPESRIELRNPSGRHLGPLWVISGDTLLMVPGLAPGATREVVIGGSEPGTLRDFAKRWEDRFQSAMGQRDDAFGGGDRQPIDEWPEATAAVSFPSSLQAQNGSYVWPAGFDLSPMIRRGDRVVLAWSENNTLSPPLNQFEALRSRKGTLLRLAVPAAPR